MFGKNRAKLAFGNLPTVWIAANDDAYSTWMKEQEAVVHGGSMSQAGLSMLMSGSITFLQPNSGVEVVEMKGDRARVKVQDGEHAGKEGWVPMAFLKR